MARRSTQRFFDGSNGYYYTLAPDTTGVFFDTFFNNFQLHCGKPTVQNVVPGVLTAHEGLNREAGSHADITYTHFATNEQNIRDRAESVVFAPSKADSVHNYVVDMASLDAKNDFIDNPLTNPGIGTFPPSGCTVRTQQ